MDFYRPSMGNCGLGGHFVAITWNTPLDHVSGIPLTRWCHGTKGSHLTSTILKQLKWLPPHPHQCRACLSICLLAFYFYLASLWGFYSTSVFVSTRLLGCFALWILLDMSELWRHVCLLFVTRLHAKAFGRQVVHLYQHFRLVVSPGFFCLVGSPGFSLWILLNMSWICVDVSACCFYLTLLWWVKTN